MGKTEVNAHDNAETPYTAAQCAVMITAYGSLERANAVDAELNPRRRQLVQAAITLGVSGADLRLIAGLSGGTVVHLDT